jgi:hypothetical protein
MLQPGPPERGPRATTVRGEKDDARHGFASVDGMRLHWAELGDAADMVPVVLLHGILDAHLTWKVVAAALAADRRVLMPDLLGCCCCSSALHEFDGWSSSPLGASAAASGSGCVSLRFRE